jgi:hypothetical protein
MSENTDLYKTAEWMEEIAGITKRSIKELRRKLPLGIEHLAEFESLWGMENLADTVLLNARNLIRPKRLIELERILDSDKGSHH